jgi:ribosomal protein L39E
MDQRIPAHIVEEIARDVQSSIRLRHLDESQCYRGSCWALDTEHNGTIYFRVEDVTIQFANVVTPAYRYTSLDLPIDLADPNSTTQIEDIVKDFTTPVKRFYYESDGGPGLKTHYVVDRYADPMSDQRRTDVKTRREGRKLAKQYNANPPWPVWDTIQAERDKCNSQT